MHSAVRQLFTLMQLCWYIKTPGCRVVFRKIAENLGLKTSIRTGIGDLQRYEHSPFEDALNLQPGLFSLLERNLAETG